MPQMAPLNWVSLYILFMLMMILLVIFNYYMYMYVPKILVKTPKKKTINWKW